MLPTASIGTVELLLVLLVIIVLFGARKLPDVAKGLAEAFSAFRKALDAENNKGTDEKSDISTDKR